MAALAILLCTSAPRLAAQRGASTQAAAARRAFDRFLSIQLEQPEWVPVDTTTDPLFDYHCGAPDRVDSRRYWIASYRIVAVQVRGDRATGVADVLAAGEQGPDPTHMWPLRARVHVAHHLLRFPMRRDSGTRAWLVCPASTSGWQLGHDFIPHNSGIDPELIFQVIDSIRGVPHRRWYTIPDGGR